MIADQTKHAVYSSRRSIKRRRGTRFVEVTYETVLGHIQFIVFAIESGNPKMRVVGAGTFEAKDLQSVAAELAQLAHDFEISEAQAEGYMQPEEPDGS